MTPARIAAGSGARPASRRAQGGFTLIEVVVALAVIATVVIAIFKLNNQTIDMNNAARFHALAPLLAQAKLAEFETRPVGDLADGSGDFGETHPGFAWRAAVADIEAEALGQAAEAFKKIDVTVTLNDGEAAFTLSTYRLFDR